MGVEPSSRQRREQREDPREVWAVPDRPRPGRALGTGGAVACGAHSSGARRPSLAFPRGARPAAQPGRPPREPRLPGSCGRRRHRERERGGSGRSARECAERGRRSARLGGRGRVCAPGRRAVGRRIRTPSAPPGLSLTASAAAAQTHTHRAPPSTRRPRRQPPRLGQRDPDPSPGLARRAEHRLIFFPLHSSPL